MICEDLIEAIEARRAAATEVDPALEQLINFDGHDDPDQDIDEAILERRWAQGD